jgi:predicted nucleotidyltransferase
MVAEKQINEFISRLRAASGENLQSVILYGSAADGEFHPEFSNVNLLCILRETSFATLTAIAPAVEWWTRQKQHAPMVLTREELERSTDVFSIELLDMKQQHRVLFGDDVLSGLDIPMHLHRAQLEYELREKLILLRGRLLLSANSKKQLWELMLSSLSTFVTLFRHALIALGHAPPKTKRQAVQALAERVRFDASAFLQLLNIREHKTEAKQLDVNDVFARYLAAVQQVTAAVDKMLDSPGPHSAQV